MLKVVFASEKGIVQHSPRAYACAKVFTVLAIGPCFTLVEWQRPPFLSIANLSGNPPAVSAGLGIGVRSTAPMQDPVHKSPNPRSRKKRKTVRDTGLSGMPLPTVHYNGERICKEDWRKFTPFFLKALQITSSELGVMLKPSFIRFPSTPHRPTKASIVKTGREILRRRVASLERDAEEAMTEPPSPKEKFAAYIPRPAQPDKKVHMTRAQTQKEQAVSSSGDPFSHRNQDASQDPVTPTPGSTFDQQESPLSPNDNGRAREQNSPTARRGSSSGSSYSRPATSPRGPRPPRTSRGPQSGSTSNIGERLKNPFHITLGTEESQISSSSVTGASSPPAPPPSSASSQPDDSGCPEFSSGAPPGPEEAESSTSALHPSDSLVNKPSQRPRKHRK
ncbi:hypothetical protein EVG20_g7396 [Dentipellis fragilis]|uniref:Uncharacterized protein n=1 Tax=Dentipellis fragilis TaxID=205917 RepID=A0A4Y9YDS1_9AGAM|nr:hypothetical protein EVG20_g7396 [Dentipellis fragilis]